jgi:hypothetical protein
MGWMGAASDHWLGGTGMGMLPGTVGEVRVLPGCLGRGLLDGDGAGGMGWGEACGMGCCRHGGWDRCWFPEQEWCVVAHRIRRSIGAGCLGRGLLWGDGGRRVRQALGCGGGMIWGGCGSVLGSTGRDDIGMGGGVRGETCGLAGGACWTGPASVTWAGLVTSVA